MAVVEAEVVEKPKLVQVELLCMVLVEGAEELVMQPVVVLLVEHGVLI
jgi:hypothetical protein